MDVIRLFQALMNAIGLTFNATAYANKSTYTVNEGDVDEWWNEQTTAFRNTYGYLPKPFRMLLMAMGENEFTNMLNNLYDYIKVSPILGYATVKELMNGYSTSLNSAQQNSVDYTKDSVTKTAYNITSEILDITKQIAKAVIKPATLVDARMEVQRLITDVFGFHWNVNWDVFNEQLTRFLNNYPAEQYRYLRVGYNYLPGSNPSYGIMLWVSDIKTTGSNYRWVVGTNAYQIVAEYVPRSSSYGKQYPTLVDASVVYTDYGDAGYKYYYGLLTDSEDFTVFQKMIQYDKAQNDADRAIKVTYDFSTNSGIYFGSGITEESIVIDRLGGTTKSYAVVKDVVGVGQTIIGVTNDRADDSDDRVLIMNAEGVETLARADADAYPEVLPSTIAAQIVDIGASVTDAVSDIATKNPEYPYVPPTPIATSTGNNLFTLYDVTPTEMSQLADYLWSTLPIDSFKKLFSSPSDSLISLVGYPVDIKSSGAKNIKIGYSDSGVSSHVITDYIQEFDLGSVYIPKYYNNFLDNNPYTKVSIYLPFIGSCSLDPDIVVGATIKIKYRVELLTANCVALLSVRNINGTYPIYQFNGNLGMQFPLSSGSYASIYKNLITTGISAVAAYASGGALTPLAIASAANTVVGSKSEVSKSGNMNGSSGYCGIMKPYVIVERPVTDIPGSYAKYNGVVTNMSLSIGSLQGYCVMENVDVSTIPCSESERAEITNLLLNGFFV